MYLKGICARRCFCVTMHAHYSATKCSQRYYHACARLVTMLMRTTLLLLFMRTTLLLLFMRTTLFLRMRTRLFLCMRTIFHAHDVVTISSKMTKIAHCLSIKSHRYKSPIERNNLRWTNIKFDRQRMELINYYCT